MERRLKIMKKRWCKHITWCSILNNWWIGLTVEGVDTIIYLPTNWNWCPICRTIKPKK